MSEYRVVNPATGEVLEEFPTATDDQIIDAQQRSAAAFATWAEKPISERTEILTRVADAYAERADELAEIIHLEMGKKVAEAKGEIKLSEMIYRYFAEHAEAFMADEPLRGTSAEEQAYVRRKPVGRA